MLLGNLSNLEINPDAFFSTVQLKFNYHNNIKLVAELGQEFTYIIKNVLITLGIILYNYT